MGSKVVRDCARLLNEGHQRWCVIRVHCFPPIWTRAFGVLIGLEPRDAANAACRFESCRVRHFGWYRRWSATGLENQGEVRASIVRFVYHPPIWRVSRSGRPGPVGNRIVSPSGISVDAVLSANLAGAPGAWRTPNPPSKFRLLDWPPNIQDSTNW